MMDRYSVEVFGNCLGGALPDGTELQVDPAAEIVPLSVVVIVLRKDKGPWWRFMCDAWNEAMGDDPFPNAMGKIFLDRGMRNGREVILAAQLYPPTIGVIAVDEVEALHKVVGRANQNIKEWEATREQFNLIAWARGEKASAPINPAWRPAPLPPKPNGHAEREAQARVEKTRLPPRPIGRRPAGGIGGAGQIGFRLRPFL